MEKANTAKENSNDKDAEVTNSAQKRSSSKKRKRENDDLASLAIDGAETPSETTSQRKSQRKKGKLTQEQKQEKKEKNRTKKTKKKTPTRKGILFATPSATEETVPLSDLPPPSERSAFLHGQSAVQLPTAATVRAMPVEHRHAYITQVTTQCERVLGTIHDALSTNEKRASADVLPSLDEQLLADMVRLKHLPLARRYVEITLWKRVAQFNSDSLAQVQACAYGAGNAQAEKNRDGFLLHQSDSKDVQFNSFRDVYLKNLLENHEDDLEKIRLEEGMDIEQVSFLRKCLQSSADLFANVKCWDDNQQHKTEQIATDSRQ